MDRLIPFSPEVYVAMFGAYNAWAWPAFTVAVGLAAVMLFCLRSGNRHAGRLIALGIATYWIWTGWAFHLETYATLNWAAVPFGWLCIAQGLGSALWGGVAGRITVNDDSADELAGFALIACAAVLHPLLMLAAGQPVSHAHLFGITPATVCAVAVAQHFFLKGPGISWLLLWPAAWSAWDLAQAWTMMLYQDAALPALTLAAVAWLVVRKRRQHRAQ